jgi:hypothetical protein
MAKKSIQTLHFKLYMVLKRGFMEPFPRYHFIIIEIVGFKCIPCCCFPSTINHSLFIRLRHQSKEGLVNSKCNKMYSITTKLERTKFEGQEYFCCSSPHSSTIVPDLNHYIPKLLTFLPTLASVISCHLSHV